MIGPQAATSNKMEDVVKDILEKSAQESQKYKSTDVDKFLQYDLGALMAIDSNPLDFSSFNLDKEGYLLNLARDNTQLLLNQIWELPTLRVEEAIVAKLPKQRFRLPRWKPVPKPRTLTKWQQYAKDKGIVKKKKSKLSWDEQLKKWVPLYGFKRADAQKNKDWLLEVPQNADPNEDQFAKKMVAKSERVAKNELQRMRNIAKAKNVKVPRFGLTNPDVSSAKDLQAAVTVARASTASLGRFQDKLPKEKEARGVAAITPGASRKRKLAPTFGEDEKKHNLQIVESVLNKRPKLNVEAAVARHIKEDKIVNGMRDSQHQPQGQESQPGHSRSKGKSKGNKSKGQGKGKPKNMQRGARKGKVAGGRKRR